MNIVALREKIAIGAELTPQERNIVLDAMRFAQYLDLGEHAHTYPSMYQRGVISFLDEAWNVLDTIKSGIIPDDVRAYLAGYFGAALEKANMKGSA